MIMDSLREFVIDTETYSVNRYPELEQSESLVGILGLLRLCLNTQCIESETGLIFIEVLSPQLLKLTKTN